MELRDSKKSEGHLFMYLYTRKEIHIDDQVELNIGGNVVKRVEEPPKILKHPTFDQYPVFEWVPVIPIMENMTENEEQ